MIRSADPTVPSALPPPSGRRRRLAPGILALLLAAGLLGACTTVSETISDVFGSGEPEAESTVQTPAEAEGEQPFPNLGTVPGEAPETSSAEERAKIAEGLAADRANAEYTDEPLAPSVASAAPPVAPAAPAPAVAAAAPAQSAIETEPAIETQPASPPPQPAPSAPQPTPQVTQAPSQPAPPLPTAATPAPAQPEVLAGGSVIVNPDAVLGGGGQSATSRLLPSGESRPVALIYFRYGSAGLSRSDISVLKDVAALHQERGGLVRVIGHASQGSATGDVAKQNMANLNISLARANAVARELSRLGVPTDQIQVAAAGAQQPLYYETQATGEAGNRRVEIYLDY